jgi:hypothetical protein
MERGYAPSPGRRCVAVRRDGQQCARWATPGHEHCQAHLVPKYKRQVLSKTVAARKQAAAILKEAGQDELLVNPIYRFSSAPNKLRIALAAEQAEREQDPRVLQAALETARSKLAWAGL